MRGVGVKLADGVSSEVVLLKMGYIEFARLESSVDARPPAAAHAAAAHLHNSDMLLVFPAIAMRLANNQPANSIARL